MVQPRASESSAAIAPTTNRRVASGSVLCTGSIDRHLPAVGSVSDCARFRGLTGTNRGGSSVRQIAQHAQSF
jgi:hypothetical protein